MIKIFQKIASSLLFLFLFSALTLSQPTISYAQTSEWRGVCVGPTSKSDDVATIQGIQCLIANILAIALTAIGLAGFLMLIFAAFRWMLAGTNTQNVEKARHTVTYALVGLILALSAFMILKLVSDFTGVETILKFTIPSADKPWAEELK